MTKEATCTVTTGSISNLTALDGSGHETTRTFSGVAIACCGPFWAVYDGPMRYVITLIALGVAVLYRLYGLFKSLKD